MQTATDGVLMMVRCTDQLSESAPSWVNHGGLAMHKSSKTTRPQGLLYRFPPPPVLTVTGELIPECHSFMRQETGLLRLTKAAVTEPGHSCTRRRTAPMTSWVRASAHRRSTPPNVPPARRLHQHTPASHPHCPLSLALSHGPSLPQCLGQSHKQRLTSYGRPLPHKQSYGPWCMFARHSAPLGSAIAFDIRTSSQTSVTGQY